MPRVSVLMACYNAERHLRAAVDSILTQTFTDFEFVIVDDGSTDTTAAILDSYSDRRMVRIHNNENIGLTRSLNRGLATTQGEYVARQDADDVSLPERLRHQVAFLSENPHVAVVGSAYSEIGENDRVHRVRYMPVSHRDIVEQLFYSHGFCHGSVLIRRLCLSAVGNYNESFGAAAPAEDHDLWLRLAEHFQLANLPQLLYQLRISSDSISATRRGEQRAATRLAVKQALQRGILTPTGRSLARFLWLQTLDQLSDGSSAEAGAAFQSALQANPKLREDAEWLMQSAVRRAFEVACLDQRGVYQNGFRFLARLTEILPHSPQVMHRFGLVASGELSAALAFAAHRRSGRRAVRQFCWRAWLTSPRQRRNLGLFSIFIRSLAPGKDQGKESASE